MIKESRINVVIYMNVMLYTAEYIFPIVIIYSLIEFLIGFGLSLNLKDNRQKLSFEF